MHLKMEEGVPVMPTAKIRASQSTVFVVPFLLLVTTPVTWP